MIVLCSMSSLRRRPLFWILINLNLSDFLVGLFQALRASDSVQQRLTLADYMLSSALLLIATTTSSQYRYFQLMIASADRYYAVCKPFAYDKTQR